MDPLQLSRSKAAFAAWRRQQRLGAKRRSRPSKADCESGLAAAAIEIYKAQHSPKEEEEVHALLEREMEARQAALRQAAVARADAAAARQREIEARERLAQTEALLASERALRRAAEERLEGARAQLATERPADRWSPTHEFEARHGGRVATEKELRESRRAVGEADPLQLACRLLCRIGQSSTDSDSD